MGVSGSGKSTLGQMLAQELHLPYIEADDHHPTSNIEKMQKGIPLSDEDRWPWLDSLHLAAIEALQKKGAVISSSALKESYRLRLLQDIYATSKVIYLKGSYPSIYNRLEARNHFMPQTLLLSQFDILEEPKDALVIDTDQATPEQILQQILQTISPEVQ